MSITSVSKKIEMKTRTIIIIGFGLIFTIFGTSTFLQWQQADEIQKVSEYHRMMSIPAVTILNQMTISFQKSHVTSVGMVQTELTDEKYQELQAKYQKNKGEFEINLQKYSSLTHAQNARGVEYASVMMQSEMQKYVNNFEELLHANDLVIKQYENKEILQHDAIPKLVSLEINFHKAMENNILMEITGMEEIQNQIIGIEKEMKMTFIISIIAGIFTSVITVLLVIRFVTIPIGKLCEATKSISIGEFTKVDVNSVNSDVNNVLSAYNEMSKDLEKYKSKIRKQEKLSTIGELASRLAHDIRNPLTVIKVTLDIIKSKNKNLTAEEIKKFDKVDEAMYRITHQIDNVLDFIKGKPMEFVKHPIKKILDSVIVDLPKSDKISVEILSEDLEIECDFEAIKVVLINLVINAIQAIDDEGKIKITSKLKDDKVIIQIEDSGPGISEEILEKIFEPLYTTKQEGTGLGLASCKSIIEQHHGKISVKNNPTQFTIELPVMI